MNPLDRYSQSPEALKAMRRMQQAQQMDQPSSDSSMGMPQLQPILPNMPAVQRATVYAQPQNGQPDMNGYGSMRVGGEGTQGGMLSRGGPITQAFGNMNKAVEKFSGGFNSGTDIGVNPGTKVALPPGQWQIVKSYASDTTPGYIGDGTNSGYGNSVLARNLKTGEQLRFSHLSQNNAQEGQVLPGGMVIGATGATGNVTGPHLDLEYYDPQGKLSDVMRSMYAQYLGINGQGGGGKGGGAGVMPDNNMIEGQAINDKVNRLQQALINYKYTPKYQKMMPPGVAVGGGDPSSRFKGMHPEDITYVNKLYAFSRLHPKYKDPLSIYKFEPMVNQLARVYLDSDKNLKDMNLHDKISALYNRGQEDVRNNATLTDIDKNMTLADALKRHLSVSA